MNWQPDKIKHFWAGAIFSASGCIWLPLVALGFIAGVAKEVYDKWSGRGTPETADIWATWIGSAVGSILSVGYHFLG